MRNLAALLLLTACGMGPNPETVLSELRVVAAVAEPPEVAEGEAYDLTVTVADPLDTGADVLVWACPPEELAQAGYDTTCQRQAVTLVDDQGTVPLLGLAPVPIWTLACEPGLCGDLGALTDRDLRDPIGLLEELPLVGVAAASKTVALTDAPVEERATNPVIVEEPDPALLVGASAVEPTVLRFVVPGAETAYGSATAGGFGRPSFDIAEDGTAELEWYGPEKGPARVFVVFQNAAGGAVVWIADAVQ